MKILSIAHHLFRVATLSTSIVCVPTLMGAETESPITHLKSIFKEEILGIIMSPSQTLPILEKSMTENETRIALEAAGYKLAQDESHVIVSPILKAQDVDLIHKSVKISNGKYTLLEVFNSVQSQTGLTLTVLNCRKLKSLATTKLPLPDGFTGTTVELITEIAKILKCDQWTVSYEVMIEPSTDEIKSDQPMNLARVSFYSSN